MQGLPLLLPGSMVMICEQSMIVTTAERNGLSIGAVRVPRKEYPIH